MPYRIYQFGTTPLPPAMTEDDLSTGTTESTLVDSVGGVFDAWGLKRRLPRRQTITVRGMYERTDNGRFPDGQPLYLIGELGDHIVDHLGNRIIVDSPALSIRRNADLLKAQEGAVQFLYRLRDEDSLVQWKLARLLKVGNIRTIDDAGAITNIEAIFETAMAAWRAQALTTVSGALPALLSLYNANSIPVSDAILRITASGAITSVTIAGTGIDLTWTGAMTTGQILSIDCGNQIVRVDSTDAYTGLVRGGGHTAIGWLPIATGTSILSVTANGPGTATITFYEQQL